MQVEKKTKESSRRKAAAPSGPSLVSVVIPTYQRRDLVVRAVQELGKQSSDPSTYEVIVVVDGSTDGTARALRDLSTPMRLTILEQPNRGRPSALNAGAASAAGDVLLFLDDDMVADPHMIEEHVRSYGELRADAVLGALAHDAASPGNVLSDEVRRWIAKDFDEARSVHELVDPAYPRFIGGQFSVKRLLFEKVGGYQAAFNRGRRFGNHDLDLNLRLEAEGATVAFNGRALSTHTYVHGYRAIWRIFELMGRSDVAFDRRFPQRQPRKTRPVPPSGTRKGVLARSTLHHPWLASAAVAPLGRLARTLVDRGGRDPVTRKIGYVTLTHRYWFGVAMEGGGHDLGVGGPAPMLAVLAYHRLSPAPLQRQQPWSTSPERMAGQIRAAVDDGWQLVTPSEVAGFLSGGTTIPLRSLLVTFDDGYADLADRGLPVLRELGASAIAFVVTGKIGGKADWSDDPGPEPSPLLDADQIRSLAQEGVVEFGSHGVSHTSMPKLDDDSLRTEMLEPVQHLEDLGLPAPRFLAYPYGESDSRVRRAAASYLGSFTTRDGLIGADADWTRLPRVEVLAGVTPQQLVWRLRRLAWEEAARRMAGAARRVAGKAIGRLLP
jgi:glycosyltransferase involved in cell wall biosynthesis/peptidoglycan/xylan/chitin deacetylase (PgdA/CDA1 family)